MPDNKTKKSEITFFSCVIALIANFLIYKWDEAIGLFLFAIYGGWVLLYALYKFINHLIK